MKNPLITFMTKNEQKILGFLTGFLIVGMILYYTGVSVMYADKTNPEDSVLQKATQQDSIIKIDIRTAEAEELVLLPGIGDKRASDIIAYRQSKQFESTEELLNIKGIGAKTYVKMSPMLLSFGLSGAGVANSAKLNELKTLETSPEEVFVPSDKQELDETDKKINNEHNGRISVSDGVQSIVHLNTATKQDLISLSGIGEVKAEAILNYRRQIGRFDSVEQLLEVKGIGPKTLEKNRHRLGL